MSEAVTAAVSGAVISEDPEGATGGSEQPSPPEPGPLRCGSCALWPRQQTWLCVVPLLIGFIGLGLSLMLLKWIVVGSVKDYVPTDLVDAKGIGQDPIFLSKPSAFPKNSETTTATTTVSSRTRPGLGSHSTTTASSAGAVGPAGSGSFTPRPPNRISTRITTTTTRTPRLLPPGGRGVTPRGTTVRRVTTSSSAGTESAVPTGSVTPTTEAHQEPTAPPSPSPTGRFYLHDSTAVWTLGHFPAESSPAVPTRPPLRTKTRELPPDPTPPERSEHFKPCRDKDLAYCLNEGECFVIETLTGSHKHCRCKEGYQGVRCDQFLPKTDSILSDPSTFPHLPLVLCFASKEVYQRQVLSISCITIGISLLGMLCVAFYCRNKRRKEKLQAHLKDSHSLKSYSLNASSLMSKSTLRPQSYCKAPVPSPALGGSVHESSFSHGGQSPHTRISQKVKQHRSNSLSHSPDQRSRATHRFAPRRTPPLPHGRLNPIGGARDSGPAYQHLQEAEPSEKEAVQEGHYSVSGVPPLHPQDVLLNMQPPLCASAAGAGGAKPELQCSLDPQRAWSIPIIPSVQGPDDPSCMQTSRERGGRGCASAPGSSALSLSPMCSPAALPPTGQQQEVALLLHTAHEQLRVLAHAHRKCEDCSPVLPASFMSPAIRRGGVAKATPAETQLVHPRGPHKDNSPSCQ
ncbi:pro-neuregulin-3 [Huso huso]|uniref:Pro-neuregulin-3 n=1 Tax=Huso huso TaxID=61971 RepID=A0ABR0ZSP7_HUSHU